MKTFFFPLTSGEKVATILNPFANSWLQKSFKQIYIFANFFREQFRFSLVRIVLEKILIHNSNLVA